MKQNNKFLIATLYLLLVVTAGCRKNHNKIPAAVAGDDQVITLPANSVTLDGSASSDPDGSISTYAWTKLSGPASVAITNASAATTEIKNLVEGIYEFQLRVVDNEGGSSTDIIRVTVHPAVHINHAPVADAGPDFLANMPLSSIFLDGQKSFDPDSTAILYLWSKLSGPGMQKIIEPNAGKTQVSGMHPGTYDFELIVSDSDGLTDRDTVRVLVNRPPVAVAGPNQTVSLPANSVTLNASGSHDPDNNITSYSWTKIFGPSSFSMANAAAAQTQVTNLVEGEYMFRLQVKDAGNLVSENDVWIIVDTLIPSSIITFNNLTWQTDCKLIVNNIYSSIPQGQVIKVYVRWIDLYGTTSTWQYARPKHLSSNYELFNYEIINGNLQVNGAGIDCNFDDAQSYSIGIVLL